jgi:hypothetical protein
MPDNTHMLAIIPLKISVSIFIDREKEYVD